MRAFVAVSWSLLLPALSLAQSVTVVDTTSTSASSTSASSATPSIHRVNVGIGNNFAYEPNVTFAAVGDIVQFVFYPSNHSVIRSEYTGSNACGSTGCNPCVPYDTIHGNGGFHSGNVITQNMPPLNSTDGQTKTWNYTVTDLNPVFYYCNALGSCNPNGMVGAINPNEQTSLDKQKAAAIAAPFQLAPGEAWPSEGAQVGSEGMRPSSAPNATSSSTPSSSTHHSLSGGAIAGIVIGGLAVLGLAAALFYFMGRNKTYKDMFKSSHSNTGGMSQAGDNVAPWTAGPHSSIPGGYRDDPSPQHGGAYQDHRISHMTHTSAMTGPSDGGTFVGYNRNTGAPEFAAEAAAEQPGPQYSRHTSPQVPQGGFTPPKQHQVFEAPGDTPTRQQKE